MGERWTPREKSKLEALWAEGKTVSEIAKVLNKSDTGVKNQRRFLGLARRRTGDLTEKVKVGIHPDEYALLRLKAGRLNQSVPGRIRQLIREDLRKP